jgi:hypothetical protein
MLLAVFLSIAAAAPVFAGLNKIDIFVDLAEVNADVPPVIANDRTLVPLRAVSEAVGCKVDWYGEERRVVVYAPQSDKPLLSMTIGVPFANVSSFHPDGTASGIRSEPLDAPPAIYEGRTMVPLRFIAETLGFDVTWDAVTRTVNLYSAAYLLNSKRLVFDASKLDEIDAGWSYMLDNSVLLQIDMYPPAGNDSANITAQLKKAEGDLTLNEIKTSKELSNKLLHPSWIISYDIGANRCLDAYIQTEYEDFRFHSIAPKEYFEEYKTELMRLIQSVELVRNLPLENR